MACSFGEAGATFLPNFMSAPHYVTNDTYLAAFLVNRGGSLAGLRRIGPKKMEYRFIATRELHDLLRLYWNEIPLTLIARRLFNSHQFLKRRSIEPW